MGTASDASGWPANLLSSMGTLTECGFCGGPVLRPQGLPKPLSYGGEGEGEETLPHGCAGRRPMGSLAVLQDRAPVAHSPYGTSGTPFSGGPKSTLPSTTAFVRSSLVTPGA